MTRKLLLPSMLVAATCATTYLALAGAPVARADAAGEAPGALHVLDRAGRPAGLCPLEHTDVKAEISGPLSRVTVTQRFSNPSDATVEAVYTFPLPSGAAVDRMTMRVGDRVVSGKIKPREEARAIYDAARNAGQVASLLDQERPNVFTQSVANITPGARVEIEISYVETLAYEDGSYTFVFPMVVGPRYVPSRVTDAAKISPPVAAPGTRAGHDVSVEVAIDAGVPLMDVRSTLHKVDVQRTSDRTAVVTLADKAEIPNRDFILTFDVAGRDVEDAVLAHRDERGGFFALVLQPPDRVAAEDVAPRELVFVLDTSGSMSGYPIEKAKETMESSFAALRPQDTFNLITFSGDTNILFPAPVSATDANLARAREFLRSRSGAGGTEMMAAIRAALEPSDKQDHVRIVCFVTDGYVGNDMEIVGEIQKHPNARVFSFGIGDSTNRFLLDKMAEEGRGEVEYVTLADDGSAAARRFAERVRNPLLTDVSIDWGGLDVSGVSPARVPDVFGAKPIVVTGRYTTPGAATIRVRGRQAGRDVVRELRVELPDREPAHDVLAALWARREVDAVMRRDWAGAQTGSPRADVREAVTKLGLDFGLMTQYTSFVAVEEMVVNDGGVQRRVEVPVEMPEGVSYEGVFGDADRKQLNVGGLVAAKPMRAYGRGDAGTGAMQAPASPAAEEKDMPAPPPSPADAWTAKLAPAVAAVVERVKSRSAPAAGEGAFVRDGKAEVRVWLTDVSEATLAKLRALGFEVVLSPKTAKLVVGRIAVGKLGALARLAEVQYVAPSEP
jgi:Ca-activated chloride channel family protein